MNEITLDFSKLLEQQPDQMPGEPQVQAPQDAQKPQDAPKTRADFKTDLEYVQYIQSLRTKVPKAPTVAPTPAPAKQPLEAPSLTPTTPLTGAAPKASGLPPETKEIPLQEPDVGLLEETGRVLFTTAYAPVEAVKTIFDVDPGEPLERVFPPNPFQPKTILGNVAATMGEIIVVDTILSAGGGLALKGLKGTKYARHAQTMEAALEAAKSSKLKTAVVGAARGTVAAELVTPEDQSAAGLLRGIVLQDPVFGEGIRNYLKDGKDETWDQQVVQYAIDVAENTATDLAVGKTLNGLKNLKKKRNVLAAAIGEPDLAAPPAAGAPAAPEVAPRVTGMNPDATKFLTENSFYMPVRALEIIGNPTDNIVSDFREAFGEILKAHGPQGVNRRNSVAGLLAFFFDPAFVKHYSQGQQKLLAERLIKDPEFMGVLKQIREVWDGGNTANPLFKKLNERDGNFFKKLLDDMFPESGKQRFKPAITEDTKYNTLATDAPLLKTLTGYDPGQVKGVLSELPEETILGALDRLKDLDLNAVDAVDLAIAEVLPPARAQELTERTKAAVFGGFSPRPKEMGFTWEAPIDYPAKAVAEASGAAPTAAFVPKPGTVQPQLNPVEFLGEIIIQNDGQNVFSTDVVNAVTALFQEAPQYMDQASRVMARGKLVKSALQRRLIEISKDTEMIEALKDAASPNYGAAKAKLGEAKFALDALTKLDAVLAMNIDRIRAGVDVAVNPIPGAVAKYSPMVVKSIKLDIAEKGVENVRESLISGFLNNSPENQQLVTKYVREYAAKDPQFLGFGAFELDMAQFPQQPDHINIAASIAGGKQDTDTVARYIAAKIVKDGNGMRNNPHLDSVIDALSGRWADRRGRFAEYFVGEKDGKLFLRGDFRNLGRGPGKETDFKSLVEAERAAHTNATRTGLLDGPEAERYRRKIDFLSLALKNADELAPEDVKNILDIAVNTNVPASITNILGEGALVATGGIDPTITTLAIQAGDAVWNNVTDVMVLLGAGDATARAEARVALYATWNGIKNWKRSGKAIGTGVADGIAGASRVVSDVDAGLMISPEHMRAIRNAETAQKIQDGLGIIDKLIRSPLGKGAAVFKDLVAKRLITAAELAVTNVRYQQEILQRWATKELATNPNLTVEKAFEIANDKYNTYVKNSRAATAGTIYRGIYEDVKKVMPGATDSEISAVAHERFRAAWKDDDIVALSNIHSEILEQYAPTSAMAAVKDPSTQFLKSETKAWRSAFNMVNTMKDVFASPFLALWNIGRNAGAMAKAPWSPAPLNDKLAGSLLDRLQSSDPRVRAKAHASATAAGFLWFMALRAAGMGDEDNKSPYEGPTINPPLPSDPRLAKQLLDGGYQQNSIVIGDKQIALPPTMALAWAAMYKSAAGMKKATDEAEFKNWAEIGSDGALLLIKSANAWSGGGINVLGKILGDDAPTAGVTDPRAYLTWNGLTALFPGKEIVQQLASEALVKDEWEARFSADLSARMTDAEKRNKELRSYGMDWLIPEERTTALGEKAYGGKSSFRLTRTLDPTSPTYRLGVQGVRLPRIPAEVYGIDLAGDETDAITKDARTRGADTAMDEIAAIMNEEELDIDPQNPTLPGSQKATLRGALEAQLNLKRSREQTERDVAIIVDRFRNFAYDAYSDETNPKFNRAFATLYREMKGRR